MIFEVVIYQARYLINDVRGRVDDASPSTYKRRFPKSLIGSATEALALRYAFYSLLVRVVVGTALLFSFAPNRSRSWIVCILILVGVVSISLLYEQLRKITDLEFKKASSEGFAALLADHVFDCYVCRNGVCTSVPSGVLATRKCFERGLSIDCLIWLVVRRHVRLHDMDH